MTRVKFDVSEGQDAVCRINPAVCGINPEKPINFTSWSIVGFKTQDCGFKSRSPTHRLFGAQEFHLRHCLQKVIWSPGLFFKELVCLFELPLYVRKTPQASSLKYCIFSKVNWTNYIFTQWCFHCKAGNLHAVFSKRYLRFVSYKQVVSPSRAVLKLTALFQLERFKHRVLNARPAPPRTFCSCGEPFSTFLRQPWRHDNVSKSTT